MVFIATPHRGSQLDRGPVGHIGSRLVRLPDPLRASYNRLIAKPPQLLYNEPLPQRSVPTSLDELEWESPILMRLDQLEHRGGHEGPFHHRRPPRSAQSRRQ